MNLYWENKCSEAVKNSLLSNKPGKPYKLTPFIMTFCEGELTSIDIRSFIEMGMKIFRFSMSRITIADKIAILKMLKVAVKWICAKYDVSTWPITIAIDIPNATINSGYLKDGFQNEEIEICENWIIEVTANLKYWRECDSKRICINDEYIIKDVVCGTEISIRFGKIVMVVIEVVNALTLKCKVLRGAFMRSLEYVCVRGVKHTRPLLSQIDLDHIQLAKEFQMDIVTINYLRRAETLKVIRKLFSGKAKPLIVSTICEQEGLDNIDEIIQNSDAIILAREFLAHEIVDPHKMITIQLNLNAKCKQSGVPFYMSGNILEYTLETGVLKTVDLDDITNAVLQGAGLVLRNYKDPAYAIQAIQHIDTICKEVEPFSTEMTDFWRIVDVCPVPVNAAEGCIVACAIMAKVSQSVAIIVPTVTGSTALWISQMAPDCIILAISRNPKVARKLQIRRGIIPIVYDKSAKPDWGEEMEERIKFAINYGIKYDILTYGSNYVAIKKLLPTSAYADSISSWTVVTEESKKIRCKYHTTHGFSSN